jgi:type I restriction-modification system DNA methylase subunit
MATKEEFKTKLEKLIEQFQNNEEYYKSKAYKEDELRQEFINPFFKSLGWDMENESNVAPQYRDVIHEDRIEIEGKPKAPDYSFKVGSERKFFVEAKAASIKIISEFPPSFQLRRYAWSGKLPVSLLTDFEEFSVYDTTLEPKQSDKAETARVKYIHYKSYLEEIDYLWDTFSREAVWKGSFDKFAKSTKRGTELVDRKFLNEIETWRNLLAKDIASNNRDIDIYQLNEAVQKIIDRIIFLRIAEDRGIEFYETLKRTIESKNTYELLINVFKRAQDKYNSNLFDFSADNLTTRLKISDKVLDRIIGTLYYPKSPYEFSVIGVEILGSVYEQFLGKVIRLTKGHNAIIEEKPEVKKSGGVYYTPQYIVDYIVTNTIGDLIIGKTPKEISKLKIVDPACGSGSFLIGAYNFLLDWHLKYYVENDIDKNLKSKLLYKDIDGNFLLSTAEKKRILLNNIHGVDIDSQAVEVTKLSLALKMLENENSESINTQLKFFADRILPDLGSNIKYGNSLVESDYYNNKNLTLFSDDEIRKVNAFDWKEEFAEVFKQGGFDAVIGNPPYIRIQVMKEWALEQVEYFRHKYQAATKGNYDIYVVFIEKTLALLNNRGKLGYILPHKFLNAQYGQPLRGLISQGKHLSKIVHFGDQQVFDNATTYTCLLFLSKHSQNEFEFTKIDNLEKWRNPGLNEVHKVTDTTGMIKSASLTPMEWNFHIGKDAKLVKRLSQIQPKLGDVASIFVGLQTSADKIYVLEEVAKSDNTYVNVKDKNGKLWKLEKEIVKPFLNDSTVTTFVRPTSRHWLIFPYHFIGDKVILISEKELSEKFPNAWSYLEENSKDLRNRESGKANTPQWYGYLYRKNLTLFEQPKLIVQVISLFGRYALDENNLYFTGGGNGPYYGVFWNESYSNHSIYYLQALLNSKLLDNYLHKISSPFRGGYWSYGKRFIEQLPIITINFDNSLEKSIHDEIVALVGEITQSHKHLNIASEGQKKLLNQKTQNIKKQIDELVYKLYNLEKTEINIIEDVAYE